jgi:hypothetical protein
MDRYAELILKLLEIQSGSRPRSPEVIAEDEQLIEGLERRYQAALSNRCSDLRKNPHRFSPTPPTDVYVMTAARSPQASPTLNVTDVLRRGTSRQVDKAA